MGDTTIEWTRRPGTKSKTWNVCRGCSYESEGCKNCYAARIAGRFSGPGLPYEGLVTIRPRKDGGTRHPESGAVVGGAKALWNGEVRFVVEHLLDPLSWTEPCTVFTNSMSDMFHVGFTNEQIAAIYAVEYLAPRHTFQNLTKRARRRREWFAWVEKVAAQGNVAIVDLCVESLRAHIAGDEKAMRSFNKAWNARRAETIGWRGPRGNTTHSWPLPNAWEGVSVENNKNRHRIDDLLLTPAAVRFLSCEPLLGDLDLLPYLDPTGACDCSYENGQHCEPHCAKDAPWRGSETDWVILEDGINVRSATPDEIVNCKAERWPVDPTIDWVIVGCESGPGMRKAQVDWLRNLRDQCHEHGVAFFLKQAVEESFDAEDAELAALHPQPVAMGPGSSRKGHAKTGGIITTPYLDGKQWTEYPR